MNEIYPTIQVVQGEVIKPEFERLYHRIDKLEAKLSNYFNKKLSSHNEEFLTASQIIKQYSLSSATLWWLEKSGQLKPWGEKVGKSGRICHRETIENYLKDKTA